MTLIYCYLFIIMGIMIWGVIIPSKKKISPNVMQLTTTFGGAFLFAVCFLQLLPHLFEPHIHSHAELCNHHSHCDINTFLKPGIWVLIGFLIQLFLETLTRGIEHGHNHADCCNHSAKGHVHPIVGLLRSLGYCAEGIDLEPRGKDVLRGDYLDAPWQDGFFDGIISQCSFYVSGEVSAALQEAARLLRKGGKLVFSDVTENVVTLLNQCRAAGFAVRHLEDLTDQWKEYYLEALWTQDNVCLPQGKKFSYVLFVCERM